MLQQRITELQQTADDKDVIKRATDEANVKLTEAIILAEDKERALQSQAEKATETIEKDALAHKNNIERLENWYENELTIEKEKTNQALQKYNDIKESIEKEYKQLLNLQKQEIFMIAENGNNMLNIEVEQVAKLVAQQNYEMKTHEISCDELEIDVDNELDNIKIQGETTLYDEVNETRRLRAEEGLMLRKVSLK